MIAILFVGTSPAFAETLTNPTDLGSVDVRLTYDEIVPGQLTTLNTDFLKPGTQEVQQHIDWTFTVSKDGAVIWGPTQLSHTSEGSLKNLRYEFEEKGTYNLQFTVEGILFQIIPKEMVNSEVVVGEASTIPKTSIDAQTSKSFYKQGESVGVSGKIKNYDTKLHSDYTIKYSVLDPIGALSKTGQTTPSESGSFNFNFIAKDKGFLVDNQGELGLSLRTNEMSVSFMKKGSAVIVGPKDEADAISLYNELLGKTISKPAN